MHPCLQWAQKKIHGEQHYADGLSLPGGKFEVDVSLIALKIRLTSAPNFLPGRCCKLPFSMFLPPGGQNGDHNSSVPNSLQFIVIFHEMALIVNLAYKITSSFSCIVLVLRLAMIMPRDVIFKRNDTHSYFMKYLISFYFEMDPESFIWTFYFHKNLFNDGLRYGS